MIILKGLGNNLIITQGYGMGFLTIPLIVPELKRARHDIKTKSRISRVYISDIRKSVYR